MTPQHGTAPLCSLTIDLEDWYQSSIDFDAPITERVLRNTDRVRALLDGCGVKATFFVQGMVAEKYPRLIQTLLADGHEIQSHGHSHRPLYGMDHAALRRELERSKKTIEDACGVRVTAFRAPDFSILRRNLWALDVLAELGFEVDSSIFPIALPRYGIARTSLAPERIPLPSGAEILEAPVAIWTVAGRRVPVAGGGYFRLLPVAVLEHALRAVIGSGRPAILYCHPYEFNPTELDEYRGLVRARTCLAQGLGRAAFGPRVRHLMTRLPFGRMDQVLQAWSARAANDSRRIAPLGALTGKVSS